MTPAIGIDFATALGIVRDVGARHRTEVAALGLREARGHALAQALAAPIALPSFDNSAMDGFAVRAADLQGERETALRLAGTQFADIDLGQSIGPGECLRITTGAALPGGADTVVIKENARVEGGIVHLAPGTPRGANVRLAGSDCPQGAPVYEAGITLGSAGLGLLAALGFATVPVHRRPSVAVFTTGDELRPVGTPLARGQVYDSNRVLLQALLAEEGIDTLSWPTLPDDPVRLATALRDAAEAYDLVITCGGVSAGEKDHLPALLREHGHVHFWKVMMRPGMPLLFGGWDRALFLGLPGNPVSVLATFRQLALPLLDAMQGRSDRPAPLRARLVAPVRKTHARLEFRRARLACDDAGRLGAAPHPADGSHQQRGAAESNALMVLPETARDLAAGEVVDVIPYGPLLRE
jgi:molybdopterin molybdotransferase